MLVKSGDHRGTVTDGHKMVSKHVTPLIKKLPLLLFFILHSDLFQQSQQPPHPKIPNQTLFLIILPLHPNQFHPSKPTTKKLPKSTTFLKFPPLVKLALERAKCSAVFFPLVTCFWTRDPDQIPPQIHGGIIFERLLSRWLG